MRIAVASGKGGTGKTTIATSLALSLQPPHQGGDRREGDHGGGNHRRGDHRGSPLRFLDCDVEAPNAHLFLKPTFERREEVGILIPEVDEALCAACGRCAEVCQFHAIAVIGQTVLVFPELCHGCGSCALVCPEKAISEKLDVLGVLEGGPVPPGISFGRGVMNVGVPMAVPIIRQLKTWELGPAAGWAERSQSPFFYHRDTENTKKNMEKTMPTPRPLCLRGKISDFGETVILDSPPGTSCPVVESVSGADFVLLVTEPTPFGLHDLRLMVEVLQELNLPAGVVINREGVGDDAVEQFCAAAGLPVLMRIPLEREIGEGIARGKTLVEIRPEYVERFREMYARIEELVMER